MTFWEHFIRLLPRRPKPALAALYWYLTRRKVRAHNRLRVGSADLHFVYARWILENEKNGKQPQALLAAMDGLNWKPRFSVLLYDGKHHSPAELQASRKSVEAQTYPLWSCIEVGPGELGETLAKADGDYVVPLRANDLLSPDALLRFAEALQSKPRAEILFGDHDHLDGRRRRRPWFKPEWNRELFLTQDYLSPAVAIELSLARKSAEALEDLKGVLLAATAATGRPIVHLPRILAHVAERPSDDADWLAAVERHLEPLGAICSQGAFGTARVSWPLPADLPLVSIIIPTKDKIELLRPCVDGLLNRTSYDRIEILIVDNGTSDPRTIDYLEEISADPRVRVVGCPGPFNYSAINNFGARQARGAYLCLLNNDTEVIEPAWLTEMMRYAVRPDVGAVGAKLLYDDGTIQHAGVIVGIGGGAGHAHRFLANDEPGYFRLPHVAQFVTAVTAACLLIDKRKFMAVGGLDEIGLQVAFNDVDLCLKLRATGLNNVYVPHAVLLHHESKSRGSDSSRANVERFRRELAVLRQRWGTETYRDPFHNPNLDRRAEAFVIQLNDPPLRKGKQL